MSEVSDGLLARLDRHEDNFNRRMDKQDRAIEQLLEQARMTNGRVTTLESDRAVVVAVKQESDRQRAERMGSLRFRLGLGVALVAGAIGTLVGELSHHLF